MSSGHPGLHTLRVGDLCCNEPSRKSRPVARHRRSALRGCRCGNGYDHRSQATGRGARKRKGRIGPMPTHHPGCPSPNCSSFHGLRNPFPRGTGCSLRHPCLRSPCQREGGAQRPGQYARFAGCASRPRRVTKTGSARLLGDDYLMLADRRPRSPTSTNRTALPARTTQCTDPSSSPQ